MLNTTKAKIVPFEYNGNQITFDFGDGNLMVNATEMAKPFGKKPHEFLRLPSTIEFIEALKNSEAGKSLIAENQILRVVRGGLKLQGTWMHKSLALKFAGWLAPTFEVWMMQRVEELMTQGYTELPGVTERRTADGKYLYTLEQMEARGYVKLPAEWQDSSDADWHFELVDGPAPRQVLVATLPDGNRWYHATQVFSAKGLGSNLQDTNALISRIPHQCVKRMNPMGSTTKRWFISEAGLAQFALPVWSNAPNKTLPTAFWDMMALIMEVEPKEVRIGLYREYRKTLGL